MNKFTSGRDFLMAKLKLLSDEIDLKQASRPEMGDYAWRVNKSPQEVMDLAEQCQKMLAPDMSVEVLGNYINFRLSNEFLGKILEKIIANPRRAAASTDLQRVVVEYSSPNTNKPLHLGHARNGVLGVSLANLLEYGGDTVFSACVVNDRGIHICKSMVAYQRFGNGMTPEASGVKGDHFVGEYYMRFEKELRLQTEKLMSQRAIERQNESDDDWKKIIEKVQNETEIMQTAREMLQKWEEGDEAVLKLWRQMTDWVIKGFQETYQRFGETFDKLYFESEVYKAGKDLIDLGLHKGVFERRDDGAAFIDLTKDGLGKKVLLRADGTSVYITQDLALAKLKAADFNVSRSIYVVAVEQVHYFKVLFKIFELLGFEWTKGSWHYAYEMVELPSGRMKSREGTVVDLDQLLDALKERVLEIAKDRESDEGFDLEANAELIGQAALKFFLLSVRPTSRIKFDIEKSLAFDGKTGPYVMYQYVRANKILQKNSDLKWQDLAADYTLLHGEELRQLLFSLSKFGDVLKKACLKLDQTLITDLLYEIAVNFSKFYNVHNIKREPDQKLRATLLKVVFTTKTLMEELLTILGIETVRAM